MSLANKNGLVSDLLGLLLHLPRKRKIQLGILFVLQILSALSDVISLGAVIPFLGVLTDMDTLMQNAHIQTIMTMFGISESKHLAILLATCFASAIVIANTFRFVTLWFQTYMTAVIGTDIGAIMFRKTLYEPYSFFIQNNSSEIIGNMTNDLNATLGILQSVLMLVAQTLIALAIIIGLLVYDPLISTGLGLTVICAYAAIIFSIKHRLHRNSLAISDNYRTMIKTLQEGFGGIGFITLSRSRELYVDQYRETAWPFRAGNADNSALKQCPKFIIESVGIIAISALAIFLTLNADDTAKVVPLLGFLGLAAHRLLPAGQQIYTSLSAILGLRVSLSRTLEVITKPIDKELLQPADNPIKLQESIKFNNVWFDYNRLSDKHSEDWTLQGLDIEIKAKTTVAFVGQTGSGKSTVADIILGLLSPQKGFLTVDGKTLDNGNIGNWQACISYVPQTIFLTDASIAENIAFGVRKKDANMEQIRKVARLAQIDDFIQTLPEKYDEVVGERGVRLSGGQLQRIGIARALYNTPSVIVFDEATSALDSNTEKEVMASIEKSCKDVTVILIAHRMSTVKKADTIFVLKNGQIAGQGNYDELLSGHSVFKDLVNQG